MAVQARISCSHNEELRAAGVHILASGHGQYTLCVLQVIGEAVRGELPCDAVARSARACAIGIAALNHEAGNDAVEDRSVIETFVNE
ncbi:hypothetical protein D3C73_862350 [compost metagenome]